MRQPQGVPRGESPGYPNADLLHAAVQKQQRIYRSVYGVERECAHIFRTSPSLLKARSEDVEVITVMQM